MEREAWTDGIAALDEADWHTMTQVLTLNDIRTVQDLSGTPPEHVYSTDGIYELLQDGENFHPMMKFLEEAELELKCLALDATKSPVGGGQNMSQHCQEHGKPMGSGLKLPAADQKK